MERVYRALVWMSDDTRPRLRVAVFAKDLDEAREKLERKYGKGTVFNLHNEEDANLPG
jgi:hypothetical protein